MLSLLNPTTLIALVIAIVSAGGAWTIQDWRYQSKEAQRVQQALDDERSANAARLRRMEVAATALADARRRETRLVADASNARDAHDKLRDALDNAMSDARSSQTACLDKAATFAKLLDNCAERYRSVAGEADGWASEAITQHEATR